MNRFGDCNCTTAQLVSGEHHSLCVIGMRQRSMTDPAKPTDAMVEAGCLECDDWGETERRGPNFVAAIYTAMRALEPADSDGDGDAELLTYSLHHNPNCPAPFLVRLPRGRLDLKYYSETNDACGFGKTFSEALANARAALARADAPVGDA